MNECPVCGTEIKELTDGEAVCDKCGTVLTVKKGRVYSMNDAESPQKPRVSKEELLDRLRRVTTDLLAAKDEKKAYNERQNGIIKDLEAERNDVVHLLEEVDPTT
jgi:uncharacterized Zn finger protein (UPF0148 family)